MTIEHTVSAEPLTKLDGTTLYRFSCSCGKQGHGHRATEAKAISAGGAHFDGGPNA